MTDTTVSEQESDTHVRYGAVNSQWPDEMPTPDGDEAIAAVRRLYAFAMKRPFKGRFKLTSGNRYTWVRRHVFYVNPNCRGKGWRELVHDVSHYCHRQLWPSHKPHSSTHHFLEKEMVAYVIAQGWLDGKLKKKPKVAKAKPDAKTLRYDRTLASIKRWESKAKRAETALRKLRKLKVRLERNRTLENIQA